MSLSLYNALTASNAIFNAGSGNLNDQSGLLFPSRHNRVGLLTVVSARASEKRERGLSSRNRRLDRKGGEKSSGKVNIEEENLSKVGEEDEEDEPLEGYSWPPPQLPGEEPDFWEGPQWNLLGFVVQYLWAFGIVFGIISGGIAVATYNEGATDFKETPVYKESMQSQELLEGPDASNSDVFESNPTEVAPSLE